jgi:hypothetical protein
MELYIKAIVGFAVMHSAASLNSLSERPLHSLIMAMARGTLVCPSALDKVMEIIIQIASLLHTSRLVSHKGTKSINATESAFGNAAVYFLFCTQPISASRPTEVARGN